MAGCPATGKIFHYLVTKINSRRQIIISMTQEEFVRQVQANQGIIQKICRLYGQTRPDREDLFQEIIVQLWKAVPKFQEQSRFSTWLYRVALNTAISDFRKKRRALPVIQTEVASLEIESELIDDKDERLKTLYAAISRLQEIDKAIVMLYLEDKSYDEMEDIVGISASTLRVRMNRIKEKLRELTKNTSHGS
jgi:RNA polymerase sigma-70 factor (ECF subfamily)